MNYQDNAFDRRARADINKLKAIYVIDIITAERIQEILVYLYLSQASKNQRGINLQTEKLKNALHTCPKIVSPAFSAQNTKAGCRV